MLFSETKNRTLNIYRDSFPARDWFWLFPWALKISGLSCNRAQHYIRAGGIDKMRLALSVERCGTTWKITRISQNFSAASPTLCPMALPQCLSPGIGIKCSGKIYCINGSLQLVSVFEGRTLYCSPGVGLRGPLLVLWKGSEDKISPSADEKRAEQSSKWEGKLPEGRKGKFGAIIRLRNEEENHVPQQVCGLTLVTLGKFWYNIHFYNQGFPGSTVLKNPPANVEMWVLSLAQEDLLE